MNFKDAKYDANMKRIAKIYENSSLSEDQKIELLLQMETEAKREINEMNSEMASAFEHREVIRWVRAGHPRLLFRVEKAGRTPASNTSKSGRCCPHSGPGFPEVPDSCFASTCRFYGKILEKNPKNGQRKANVEYIFISDAKDRS